VLPARILRAVAVLLAVVSLSSCAQKGLDAEQQQAEARECASLVERHVAKSTDQQGTTTLDGQTLDLNDPATFYKLLQDLRPPGIFRMDDKRTFRFARSSLVSDLCKDKGTAPGVTTTTTTNPSTTTTTTTGLTSSSASTSG
jgi:hypothetical protein